MNSSSSTSLTFPLAIRTYSEGLQLKEIRYASPLRSSFDWNLPPLACACLMGRPTTKISDLQPECFFPPTFFCFRPTCFWSYYHSPIQFGVFFPNIISEYKKTRTSKKITSGIKFLVEILFILYTSYVVVGSIQYGPYTSDTLRFTSVTISAIMLLLRLLVLLNKSRILNTLSKLRAFDGRQQKASRTPLRKFAILACGLCIVVPLSIVVGSSVWILGNIERHPIVLQVISQNSTNKSKVLPALAFIGHQIVYLIHFFMFPGLVMTLLSFVYLSYVRTFRRHLEAIRFELLHNFSREEISKALTVFTVARKIHLDIEKTMSFITLVAYVLVFGNIIHLVCILASNYLSGEESMRDVYSISIFSWTTVGFILLTLCGSQGAEAEVFIKNMIQEVISKNFGMKYESQKEMIYMNLLNSCSVYEVRFTGWGMFEVDKKLFLTVSGVLVTYGVLFASELRKS
ncbi:uncharacterized protein NPIL_395611 [Nephila pilipes]|uniref:Gustatory receptor n=1 Tax=Nephila pilipes TaxID=299642 RepID=A0A8X6MJD5_NEPPI|nr:uncharacterized protein NPIL_395611 [Nephila pilipes]